VSVGWKLGLAVVVVVTTAMAVAFFHFTAREKAGLVDAKQKAAEMLADLFAASLRAPERAMGQTYFDRGTAIPFEVIDHIELVRASRASARTSLTTARSEPGVSATARA
jgi:hypothetical protein